jgi:hypothetical protein
VRAHVLIVQVNVLDIQARLKSEMRFLFFRIDVFDQDATSLLILAAFFLLLSHVACIMTFCVSDLPAHK